MILLADAGNTRLKWAYLNNGKRSQQFAENYQRLSAVEQLEEIFENTQASSEDRSVIKRLLLISVLGEAFIEQIKTICEKQHIVLHLVRSSATKLGIQNAYENPKQLGNDRFVSLIAAHHLQAGKHSIIVSCGTAVTIDAITATGQHLGGLILPGLQSFSSKLVEKAALLETPKSQNAVLFAKNTADAIFSGTIFGLIEAINGISLRMKNTLQQSDLGNNLEKQATTIILTGGDAETIHQYLADSTVRQDDWLMQGLQIIAESKGYFEQE